MRRTYPTHISIPALPGILSYGVAALVAGLALGCHVSDTGVFDTGSDQGASCTAPLGPPIDPSALPACCPEVGGAHCLNDDVVPSAMRDKLGACEGGGLCVPDKFIASGGSFVPRECSALGGASGRCLSQCIPQVAEFAAILDQDVCDAGELCTPCTNPIDGTSTGACDIATCEPDTTPPGELKCPYEGPPVIDPELFPSCNACGGLAHCMPSGLIDPELAGQLADCDPTSKCVPDKFIASAGNFVPDTCASIGGVEGRCLSSCLPAVAEQAGVLQQASCGETELCVPCFDPITGMDTGACRLSCDPGPSGPPGTLPQCCGGQGTCVPGAAAGDNADQLGQDVCPGDGELLCAPNVFIQGNFTPPTCETGFISFLFGDEFKRGACLPECLPAVDNILIGQDGCLEGNKCAPCLNPLTGEPSGACEIGQPPTP